MQESDIIQKKETKKALNRRKWGYRLVGTIVILFSIWIWIKGGWEDIPVAIGTVILIIGIAIWMLGSPEDNNMGEDTVSMISMEVPRTIEEFYEAYRKMATPLGSAYLGNIATMKQRALIWGPDSEGEYLYFWLNKSGIIGYLGYSFLENLITEHITEPEISAPEDTTYPLNVSAIQAQLLENLKHYAKTGEVL